MHFISLGNELKPEPAGSLGDLLTDFISLGNELKPEHVARYVTKKIYFISLGNELKPELNSSRPTLA